MSPVEGTGPQRVSGPFAGRTAIVTGGGSGIGAAFTRALVAAGAEVICADIDLTAAQQTVIGTRGPGSARASQVDVTSSAAVQKAVDHVVAEHGHLDLMFNNAGITFLGDAERMTVAQWDQIVDVNVKGVVYGVAAAYPQMIRQGSGHIVNTASAGGLLPAGLLAAYSMTKHAVVGLSHALRSEAASRGVGVTVVCPAAVDTPILDKGELSGIKGRDFYLTGQGVKRAVDPDVLASKVLAAVAANEPIVVEPLQARLAWRFSRLAPGLFARTTTKFVEQQRARAR